MTQPTDPALNTEDKILEAAHRVFLRRGVAGARMQTIAQEADVNQALLHYYFRSKQRLAEAVFARAAQALFPRMIQLLAAADLSLEEKVRQVVAYEIDFLSANPYLPGFILAEFQYRKESLLETLQGLVSRTGGLPLDAVQDQLDAEAEAGRIRPIRAVDFLINLISLIVFPFAAAPMLEVMVDLRADAFGELIERRRTELPGFFLRALRP